MFNNYRKIVKGIMYLVLVICALMALYPLYFMLITSLKGSAEYVNNKLFIPKNPMTDNYTYV
ncbi:MAG: carbohydrate ABC transporter permease, partial [Sphaerochaeta sp.]|nr:carbohydrate ABC transporter permease [Sphaerochaeta sp.]